MNKEYVSTLARNIHALIAAVEPHVGDLESEVAEQEREWAQVCELLGLDVRDDKLRACALAFMEYLLELLTGAEASKQTEQAVALRSAATTLAMGIFGRDYLDTKDAEVDDG